MSYILQKPVKHIFIGKKNKFREKTRNFRNLAPNISKKSVTFAL